MVNDQDTNESPSNVACQFDSRVQTISRDDIRMKILRRLSVESSANSL